MRPAMENQPLMRVWTTPQRERQDSIPRLRAMDSTLCKLSMVVGISKAACNKHPWVWFNMKCFYNGGT